MSFYRFDPALQRGGDGIVRQAVERFAGAGLTAEDLALTLVLPGAAGGSPIGFAHRAGHWVYPASVVKLFYLVAAQGWLEAGTLQPSPELDRALQAMIAVSSNDATNYLIDLLTGTTSGPELPEPALSRWLARRRAVNRYFAGWGWPEFSGLNASQKVWDEAPYGREQQSRLVPNSRNRLSTDATARLLWAIDIGAAVSSARSAAIRALLARTLPPPARHPGDPEDQVTGFLGEGLPPGSKLWSKAGWTSQTRHDAAIVALPGGARFILVVFTQGAAQSANTELLPWIAGQVVSLVGTLVKPPVPA